MARIPLNAALLRKMADKTKKSEKYLREQISKKGNAASISSPAAQILMAKDLGIGTNSALNGLPAHVREEVRAGSSVVPSRRVAAVPLPKKGSKQKPITPATIDALLRDSELRARCKGLLKDKRHFDRVIREATTILDDRIKKKTGIVGMNPENLVGRALNPDPSKAVIVVSSEGAEQKGIHSICTGIMLAFRNKAHHNLSDKYTAEDALKFCGFIDTVLGVIEQGKVHLDRA